MKKLTAENFDSIVNSEKNLFVIKFFSPSCGPCRTMTPVFEALDNNNPEVNVYEINTAESPELAGHFNIRGVPHVAYCEKREVIYSFTGLRKLADLQYVIDNVDNEHFREHGDFKIEERKKSYWFEIIITIIILSFITAIALLSLNN